MDIINHLSKEALRIPVAATGIDLTTLIGFTVDVAVLTTPADPAGGDWKTAAWTASSEPDHPAAKLVIGPGASSGLTFSANTVAYGWVRVTGGGNIAVSAAGPISVV